MAVQADLLRGTPLTAMVNANRRQPTQLDLYNERKRKEIQSQSNQFQKLAFDLMGLQAKQQQQALENQLNLLDFQRKQEDSKSTRQRNKAQQKKAEADTRKTEVEIRSGTVGMGSNEKTRLSKAKNWVKLNYGTKENLKKPLPSHFETYDDMVNTLALGQPNTGKDYNSWAKAMLAPGAATSVSQILAGNKYNTAAEINETLSGLNTLIADSNATLGEKNAAEKALRLEETRLSETVRVENKLQTTYKGVYKPSLDVLRELDSFGLLIQEAASGNSVATANLDEKLSQFINSGKGQFGGSLVQRFLSRTGSYLQGNRLPKELNELQSLYRKAREEQLKTVEMERERAVGFYEEGHPYQNLFPPPVRIPFYSMPKEQRAIIDKFALGYVTGEDIEAILNQPKFEKIFSQTQLSKEDFLRMIRLRAQEIPPTKN